MKDKKENHQHTWSMLIKDEPSWNLDGGVDRGYSALAKCECGKVLDSDEIKRILDIYYT